MDLFEADRLLQELSYPKQIAPAEHTIRRGHL